MRRRDRRRLSRPGVEALPAGSKPADSACTYNSPVRTPRRCRTNASVRPSGEIAGSKSAPKSGAGLVMVLVAPWQRPRPSSTTGSPGDGDVATARKWLSADQARIWPSPSTPDLESPALHVRDRRVTGLPGWRHGGRHGRDRTRSSARRRPRGTESIAGSVVRRCGDPAPISLHRCPSYLPLRHSRRTRPSSHPAKRMVVVAARIGRQRNRGERRRRA